jgi:hypothetical protein
MNLKMFLMIAAAIAVFYGIAFLLIPNFVMTFYGITTSAPAIFPILWGSASFAGIGHLVPHSNIRLDSVAGSPPKQFHRQCNRRVGLRLGNRHGIMNAMGWSAVLIYLVLFAGCVYYLSAGHAAP